MKSYKSIVLLLLIVIAIYSHSHSSQSIEAQHIHDQNCQHHHQQDQHQKSKLEQSHNKDQFIQKVQTIRKKYEQQLNSQTNQQKIVNFFRSCQKEIGEWISLPKTKQLQQALLECQVLKNKDQIIQFYEQLSNQGSLFSKQHIQLLPKLFRKYKNVAPALKCLSEMRQFQNKFFTEKKKYKYLYQFLNSNKQKTYEAFPQHRNYTLKGEQTCHFLKVFFEYYYVQVVSSFETLSTTFMRALTVRSRIFDHFDISYCLSLETIGKLSEAMENLDINNIYLKIPQIYHQLVYLKLKQRCKDEQNKNHIKNIKNALNGMDMFTIMFNQYQPFVEIAAQKFGHSQIRLLARKFAEIIENREKYLELSKKNNEKADNKVAKQRQL